MMERRDKYDRNIKIGEKWETCLHFLWLVIIPEKELFTYLNKSVKVKIHENTIWLGLILTSCRGSWQRKGRRWRGRHKSRGRNQGPSAATSQIDEDVDDWEPGNDYKDVNDWRGCWQGYSRRHVTENWSRIRNVRRLSVRRKRSKDHK